MNLHAIVAPLVAAVNPSVPVVITPSMGGYTYLADGTRQPQYGTPYSLMAQVQNLTYTDIQQVNGLNLTGVRRAAYLSGDVEGIIRVAQKGGDLLTMQDGSVWLIAHVLENWVQDGWVKVVLTLQNEIARLN